MNENEWELHEAESHFSDLIDSAQHRGPQTIHTAPGADLVLQPAAPVSPKADAKNQSQAGRPSIVSLFKDSPLQGLRIPRVDEGTRPTPFEFHDWEEDGR